MKEDCAEMSVQLSAWIDGELDASAAAMLQEHLAICVSCQRRHALLAAAARAVRSVPEETVSASFEHALRRRLAAAGATAEAPRRPWQVVVAASLAAVVVLVVLGMIALHQAPRGETREARSENQPGWLGPCGALGAGECQRETPCASAPACQVAALTTEPSARFASVVAVPPEAPCATAATCGVVSVATAADVGRFAEASRDN